MTDQTVQWLDDLGAELSRAIGAREAQPRRFRTTTRRRALAIALSAVVVVGAGGYAVPPTRAAIEDLTSSFAGWLSGDDSQAPGRELRPADDAPDWVREEGGRTIAENGGVKLFVSRAKSSSGTLLRFTLGDGTSHFNTVAGWRKTFDEHAVVVLGRSLVAPGKRLDDQGRFPLLGVTARSVERVELRYDSGRPLVSGGLTGGFVLMADAQRPLRELVAFDAAGRELERSDVSQFSP